MEMAMAAEEDAGRKEEEAFRPGELRRCECGGGVAYKKNALSHSPSADDPSSSSSSSSSDGSDRHAHLQVRRKKSGSVVGLLVTSLRRGRRLSLDDEALLLRRRRSRSISSSNIMAKQQQKLGISRDDSCLPFIAKDCSSIGTHLKSQEFLLKAERSWSFDGRNKQQQQLRSNRSKAGGKDHREKLDFVGPKLLLLDRAKVREDAEEEIGATVSDSSFKTPAAVPFKWEVVPGTPKAEVSYEAALVPKQELQLPPRLLLRSLTAKQQNPHQQQQQQGCLGFQSPAHPQQRRANSVNRKQGLLLLGGIRSSTTTTPSSPHAHKPCSPTSVFSGPNMSSGSSSSLETASTISDCESRTVSDTESRAIVLSDAESRAIVLSDAESRAIVLSDAESRAIVLSDAESGTEQQVLKAEQQQEQKPVLPSGDFSSGAAEQQRTVVAPPKSSLSESISRVLSKGKSKLFRRSQARKASKQTELWAPTLAAYFHDCDCPDTESSISSSSGSRSNGEEDEGVEQQKEVCKQQEQEQEGEQEIEEGRVEELDAAKSAAYCFAPFSPATQLKRLGSGRKQKQWLVTSIRSSSRALRSSGLFKALKQVPAR